jgi:2-oxoisovalerate dehydrogenase E1 component alpha subunit
MVDAAGSVPRPDVDAAFDEVNQIVHGLVRILDDEGAAVGPWRHGLGREALVRGLRDMATVRAFDEAMLRAHRQGKTSFYMQSLGEEAVACAHRRALEDGDMCFPTYRQQGLLVSAGYPLVDMMNQVFSNSGDPVKGRQLPVFYSSKAHGFFSISGNLGTQYVQAVGWAMAAAIDGSDHIASAWIGEGATAESDFHAALVFASTFHAPVILNIVNNQWAISTHQAVARGAAPTFADRGLGFGIPAIRVDGNDYLAVDAASRWGAERARRGLGPTMIEWVTYRAGAHSTSDDPSAYRERDAWSSWPLGDPVERLARHLRVAHGWTDD